MHCRGLSRRHPGEGTPRQGPLASVACVAVLFVVGCAQHSEREQPDVAAPEGTTVATQAPRPHSRALDPPPRLANRIAYIPPQCFTKTRAERGGSAKNPCYACHTRSEPPNYTNDDELQLRLALPAPAKTNPWTNLFDPPVEHGPHATDDEILAYVRESNYFDDRGNIALAEALRTPPSGWDANANGKWDGFTPDVWFKFDDHGFDHRPDGSLSGWRAFAYYPFLGTFFPTNGSIDDVAIRLDPIFRQDKDGRDDQEIYELNLAIVEALIRRTDVAVDSVDETKLGVDLDLNGHLGRATRVAFDGAADGSGRTRMHYVGLAHEKEAGSPFPIGPGLFPIGTEFFHTVRYLDIGADGVVTMAPRMKEVRYARKVRWASYEISRINALREAQEQDESSDGTRVIHWASELGVSTRTWLLQGFIEGIDGALRPQSFDETAFCEGCHGGVGVTTDGTFSFARKLGEPASAHGWFHWSQHDLRGVPEPKRADGEYEYSLYLREAGAGDELRENTEVTQRFFDDRHEIRPAEIARLHGDVSYLLLPSRARALDLDRAYRAIVLAQSFDKGRDGVLVPARNVYTSVPIGESTGVREAVVMETLAPSKKLRSKFMGSSHAAIVGPSK